MNTDTSEITALVKKDFELSATQESLSEEQLLEMLSDEVALMIETRLDFLLGLMYRLDIDERKIEKVLSFGNEEPANVGLARLILERQKQRIWSKKTFKADKIEDWDDFE
jgi:hypothetical protein